MMLHLMPDYPSDLSHIRDWPDDKHKFCNSPSIFIGFNPKGSSDSDRGAKSPTSPLDIKTFSGVGITGGHQNSLDPNLISPKQQGETILIGSPHGFTKSTSQSGMEHSERAKSPTSPLDIKTFSGVGINNWHQNCLDPNLISPKQQGQKIPIGSPHGFTKSTSQSGMEHSESYTCVTSHGPTWSTKHRYTRGGMESETVEYPAQKQHEHGVWDVAPPRRSNSNIAVFHVQHFLHACYLCKRQLNHGKDVYMYRGDKAFCSVECRYQQILMDERTEKCPVSQPSSRSATSSGPVENFC